MANVFVPFKHYDYEGEEIFGVFTTRDLAVAALVAGVVQPDGTVFGHEWGLWEYEVDGRFVRTHDLFRDDLIEAASVLGGGR